MAVARRCGGGESGSYFLMGTESEFYKMKNFLEMDGVEGCTTIVNVFNATELYPKNGYDGKFYLCI